MNHISRILAAVDFSTPARGAFEYTLALSKRHGAELVVIHAVPLNQAFSWRAGERLALSAKLRQKADQAHVELKHRVQQGDPVDIILLHARSLHPDVIVMGTHQRRGIDRLRVGSVAERVAAKATVPVLLVPRRRDTGTIRPFSDVAVGVDFSDVSFHALSEALALAQRSGGHLRLLHVLDGFPDETVYSGSRAFRLMDDFRARVARVNRELRSLIPADAPNGSEIEVATVSGQAHKAILAAASERRTDLIVLGLPRRSRLEKFVAGSTVDKVLRRATSPVLLVPAPSTAKV